MIRDLEPDEFVDKVRDAAKARKIEVQIVRHRVPAFTVVNGATELRAAIIAVYQFKDGEDQLMTREQIVANDHGELDLETLKIWKRLSGSTELKPVVPPAIQHEIRPVLTHRSGSV